MGHTALVTTTDVQQLRARIAHYRRGRYPKAPLPRELWAGATAVARRLGAYAASRALGVSYDALRSRLVDAGVGGPAGGTVGPTFVEVTGAQLFGPAPATGTVVEITGGDGVRMTVRLVGSDKLDVLGLVRAFRGCRP